MTTHQERLERLAGELGRWAERPGTLTPRQARTRVLARLPRRRRRPAWRLVAGGALAATALAVVLLVGRRQEPPPQPAAVTEPRTIVHQLSTGTRLYIVVRPEARRPAGNEGC